MARVLSGICMGHNGKNMQKLVFSGNEVNNYQLQKCIDFFKDLFMHIYNEFLYFTYLECVAGKFGSRCEKVCPYPFYGNLCFLTCDCNKDLCNPFDGCSGKWHITYVVDF